MDAERQRDHQITPPSAVIVPYYLLPLQIKGFRFVLIVSLGHSYAVAALQSGDDIKTVQENLGHHTAAFTLDVYGHVTEQMKQASAARMERFIQSVTDVSAQ